MALGVPRPTPQADVKSKQKRVKQLIDAGTTPKGAETQANAEARQNLPQQQAENAVNAAQNQSQIDAALANQPINANQQKALDALGNPQPAPASHLLVPLPAQDTTNLNQQTAPQPNPDNFQLPTGAGDIKANIAKEAIAGAAGVGAIGALISAPAGGVAGIPAAIAGGVAGAIHGALTYRSVLKEEYQQATKVEYRQYRVSAQAINGIISDVNNGKLDPVTAVGMYNRELARIDAAERHLKLLDEKDWAAKAKDELVYIQSFNDNQRQLSRNALQLAITSPNKNSNFSINIPGDNILDEPSP